jgi:2OG-Fe(II) oxygenase superfamily
MVYQGLASWIAPEHLSGSSLQTHRLSLREDSFRLLVIKQFLQPERAELLLEFLLDQASYEPFHALKNERNSSGIPTRGAHVTGAEWHAAAPEDRLFRVEVAQFPSGTTPATLTYLDWIRLTEGGAVGSLLAAITGEQVGDVGFEAHRMRAGDFVALHSDNRAARRFGFIIYLSREWSRNEGGALVFERADGDHRAVLPEFNCFVLFDVAGHAGHRVEPVAGARPRLSLHGWCVRPDPAQA